MTDQTDTVAQTDDGKSVVPRGSWRRSRGVGRTLLTVAMVVLAAAGGIAVAMSRHTSVATPAPHVHPPARSDTAMAFDGASGTVILFGGTTGFKNLNDTWSWDGSVWTQLHPAHSPSARSDALMAYDAATGSLILQGGSVDASMAGPPPSDQPCTSQTPATPSSAGGMYDITTICGSSFGGPSAPLSDTWSWSGSDWTRLGSTGPLASAIAGDLAADPASGQIVLVQDQAAFPSGPSGCANADCSTTNDSVVASVWNGTAWQSQPALILANEHFLGAVANGGTGHLEMFTEVEPTTANVTSDSGPSPSLRVRRWGGGVWSVVSTVSQSGDKTLTGDPYGVVATRSGVLLLGESFPAGPSLPGSESPGASGQGIPGCTGLCQTCTSLQTEPTTGPCVLPPCMKSPTPNPVTCTPPAWMPSMPSFAPPTIPGCTGQCATCMTSLVGASNPPTSGPCAIPACLLTGPPSSACPVPSWAAALIPSPGSSSGGDTLLNGSICGTAGSTASPNSHPSPTVLPSGFDPCNVPSPTTVTALWLGTALSYPATPRQPSSRSSAGMAFDAATNQVVLFGGISADTATLMSPSAASGPPVLADTWVWDGGDWVLKSN